MKNKTALPPLAWVIVTLLIVALALLAYDRLRMQKNLQAMQDTVRQTTRQIETEHLKKQDAAVQQAVTQALRINRLHQGITAAMALTTAVAEYQAATGELPGQLKQIGHDGIPPSDALAAVALHPGGVIEIEFDPARGAQGRVRLAPKLSPDRSFITGWSCTSADIPDIAQAVATCSYAPRG